MDSSQTEIPTSVGTESSASLKELALIFLRLGTTAFGGPAAHIALMEDEFVRRHRWITREKFLDLLGAANLIPGPSSTEMAIYIGYQRAGGWGLFLAGACFILPAMLLVSSIAWAYVRFGHLPQVSAVLYGVKPVVIAVVLQAVWGLARTAVKTWSLAAVGAAATALAFFNVNPLLLLASAGTLVGLFGWASAGNGRSARALLFLLAIPCVVVLGQGLPSLLDHAAVKLSLRALFLYFLKVGSVLYGSGYVLLAFLRADLVDRWHWLTSAQLLDAVAAGQVTPGPVFTTATFIGYVLGGFRGALVGTVGIFLPAFLLTAISGPFIPRLRTSVVAGAFLDGVIVASLALMAVVTFQLGRDALVDVFTLSLAVVSVVLLFRFRINSTWLVLGGALLGLAAKLGMRS
jgi:chromate transporter